MAVRSSSHRGITLMETLAVVVILAILAGLLFPVFTASKRSGKLSADLQSIHQLGTATVQYCADADELLPPAISDRRHLDALQNGWESLPKLAKPPWKPFGEVMLPYTKDRSVFLRREDRPEVLKGWPKGTPRCEFVFDELAGLAGKSLGSLPTRGTLLYGDVPTAKRTTARTPCLRYDMGADLVPFVECSERITQLEDL